MIKKKEEYWTESDYCKKFCKECIEYYPNGNIKTHGWKCETTGRMREVGIWNYWREDGSMQRQAHHEDTYGEVLHSISWHKNGYKSSEIDERLRGCDKQWDEYGEAWLVSKNIMNNNKIILGDRYSDGSIRPKAERTRIKRVSPIVKVVDIQKDETPDLDEDEMPF
jgi:hypothetical protein